MPNRKKRELTTVPDSRIKYLVQSDSDLLITSRNRILLPALSIPMPEIQDNLSVMLDKMS